MKKITFLLSALVCLLFCGCPEQSGNKTGNEISVSVAPAAYLAEQVAGGEFKINTLLAPGKNPHDYELTPMQTSRLYRSRAYFSTELPFEHHAIEAVKNKVPVIPLSRAVEPLPYTDCGHDHSHDHASHDLHEAGAIDPHVWFSAVNAGKIAGMMAEEMAKLKPEKAAFFRDNAAKLQAKFAAIEAELEADLKPFAGKTVYVYHPSFGYFVRDFNMKQRPIELEGREIPLADLNKILREAKRDQAAMIFVQPNFSSASAEALAKGAGCKVVAVDPLQYDLPGELSRLGKLISGKIDK